MSWVKTWCLDFVSTYQVYWNVPGDTLDITKLPARAFDSPGQQAETAALALDYNNNGESLTPEIDARFAKLAEGEVCGASVAVARAAAGGARCWICGCGRGLRTCRSIWTGGSTSIITRRRASAGFMRG